MATYVRLSAVAAVVLLACLVATGCEKGPEVVQGTVSSYDAATKMLVLVEENAPDSVLTIDLATAEMGQEPTAGGKIRVAYRDVSGKLQGVRVMDLGHTIQ